jgi:hypothetical protein
MPLQLAGPWSRGVFGMARDGSSACPGAAALRRDG